MSYTYELNGKRAVMHMTIVKLDNSQACVRAQWKKKHIRQMYECTIVHCSSHKNTVRVREKLETKRMVSMLVHNFGVFAFRLSRTENIITKRNSLTKNSRERTENDEQEDGWKR